MKAPELIRRARRLIWLAVAPLLHGGNRWTRKAIRRQEPAFWVTRNRVGRVRFKVLRAMFQRRRSFREGLTATMAFRGVVRAIFFPVLLSSAFVVFLIWFDYSLLPAFLDYLGESRHGVLPQSIAEPTLSWARAVASSRPLEGAHAMLLATGAQVTGVFLGLYFAAISVVASTAYGDVPPELRSVLIEDRVGRLYLSVVGFTGGACLFALGTQALGYSLGVGSAVAFALLGAASVLTFIPLGMRVFGFLDPGAVTRSLTADIETAVKSVAASGILARDRTIQADHQKTAARKLDAWEEMVFVSSGRSQTSSALSVIGQNAVLLLRWYSKAKLPIAKTSQWFERTPEHLSYLLTGGSRLSMALCTSTWIHPKMEPDQLWLEKRVGEIIQRVVVALGEKGSNRPCAVVLESFYDWIAWSAYQFRVPDVEMGLQIASRIEQAIREASTEASVVTDRDRLHGLAAMDGLARAIPNAVGHLNQRLGTLRLRKLLDDASEAAIRESFPLKGFPPRLRAIIESLRMKHSVERDVEGSIRTPSWYTEHHAARLLSVDIRNTYESLLKRAEQWLPSHAKSLREEGAVEAAVMVTQRGLEAVSKLEVGAKHTMSRLEELKRRRVKTAGERWPDVNLNQWHERLRVLRLTFIDELVHLTPLLANTPPTGDLPDGFGFAYTTLCAAMIDALEDMDPATFALVNPIVVRSALKARDRVKTELAESHVESVLYFSADVMLDVMDIAGYAYLWKFSLGEECFWDSVASVWDALLSQLANPSDIIRLITLGQDFHKQRSTTSPRSIIRLEWRARMRNVLEDNGFAPRGITSNTWPKAISVNPTAATYVATWSERRAREVMLSEYFLRRPEAEGIQAPSGIEELRRGARQLLDDRAAGRVEGGPGFSGGFR